MKNLSMLCAILISISGKSQTWNEWFQQKKTKLIYIAQQIAALQVYTGYLKQGYQIVDEGWSVIDDIKHGDFDLHNNYFNSLTQVNSSIKNYNKVGDIMTLQLQILQSSDDTKKFTNDNSYIQSVEKDYVNKVMSNLLSKCADKLIELQMITENGKVQMKDDERLKRIEELYIDMQDKYAFVKNFESSVHVLALSREKNIKDLNTSKLLYGIK